MGSANRRLERSRSLSSKGSRSWLGSRRRGDRSVAGRAFRRAPGGRGPVGGGPGRKPPPAPRRRVRRACEGVAGRSYRWGRCRARRGCRRGSRWRGPRAAQAGASGGSGGRRCPTWARSCGRKTGGGLRWMWAPWVAQVGVVGGGAAGGNGPSRPGRGFGEGRALPNVSVLLAIGRCAPFLASLVSQQTQALGGCPTAYAGAVGCFTTVMVSARLLRSWSFAAFDFGFRPCGRSPLGFSSLGFRPERISE